MNPTKRLLSSIRLANSFYSTQLTRTNQVIITHLHPFLHTELFFSSNPQQTLDLLLSENWSNNLEQQLLNSRSNFSHESVVYVLKKLSKHPQKASSFFNWVVGKLAFEPSSSIYSLMLRVYANKDSIKQFWVMVHRMKEEGFFVDDQAYLLIVRDFQKLNMVNEVSVFTKFYNAMVKDNDVVKEVVEVVIDSDWGDAVEERLKRIDFGVKLSDNFVLRVLKGLRTYPFKALAFFEWVSENFEFEHNAVTYNGILRVLGREESIQEFWNVFGEMKTNGYEMDLDTYLKVTRLFQKRKMLNEAVELYERMMDSPYAPSGQDCGVLLRTIAGSSSPDLDLVFRVVNTFESKGNSLSKNVYDGIHRSLTSVGQFEEAEKIVLAMKDAGYEPDNITYSQLIFGLCKARKLEEAAKVIDVMEQNACAPDVKTWTILIHGHCSANEVDKAVILLADMISKGCEADADLLDVLINAFLGKNQTIDAYQLLTEMVKSVGMKPWQATYKNLIQKLLSEKKFDESLGLLRLMRKHDYPPFSEAFVGYVSKYGSVDDALEFLKALSFKQSPAVSAYLNMFQRLFDEGREVEAKDLLFKCPPHVRKHKSISSIFGSVQ
ncbi:putative tetratricopeptide-like helical domain superfamily [Helianthus annuus]|uniref:Tetratricopeptide-like helical domain superfamily n=1 Tax=Helianthus annuus TaxID=4232 RepID=A0A9K3EJT9_HELAN|nr:pentatricopeptide repeat-containing protein At3g48250, chloroplastic-like [Helianthus annuus]KAF5774877.1 putative tetratricopeptide-like helical domain superfamily [Helianthus annuus]KAJ0478123.1 putative pentatricopeptide repeat-containing protein BIR6 [Helianthus annuus]KAJ0499005.1 putative pentatricopeptide repeat-containing protein BIR6 [Helianthus annuus]KAJ0665019.1 putative pentatricopeptide repeat-containing protein BIR6 [Helianthus annuus]KAJ0672442.1 putative pentatricopeptide r